MILLCAVRAESEALCQVVSFSKRFSEAGMTVWEGSWLGSPVSLIRSGMGRSAAENAATYALNRYPGRTVISFGFAGGLTPGIGVGNLALPTGIVAQPSNTEGERICPERFDGLFRAAKAAGLEPSNGTLLTANHLISRSQEKRLLAGLYSAQTVDMESYWVGVKAVAAGIPFLTVRVISDDCGEDLPPLDGWVGSDGQPRPLAALQRLAVHPKEILALMRLVSNIHTAQRTFKCFFRNALDELVSEF